MNIFGVLAYLILPKNWDISRWDILQATEKTNEHLKCEVPYVHLKSETTTITWSHILWKIRNLKKLT